MGIFHKMAVVYNRAPINLNVRFDGQDTEIPPGLSQIPELVIPWAKNQNPIMGSADPLNPSITGSRYLLGVVGSDDEVEDLTKDEWDAHCAAVCRMDWQALMEERLGPHERVIVKGKKGGVQAKSSFDTGVRVRSGPLEKDIE